LAQKINMRAMALRADPGCRMQDGASRQCKMQDEGGQVCSPFFVLWRLG